jgi:hypothetical protein
MSYFIRREVTYSDGERSVTFWRGPSDPTMWVYHHSDAAKYPQIKAARAAFKQSTGYFPGRNPREAAKITVVGGTGVVGVC